MKINKKKSGIMWFKRKKNNKKTLNEIKNIEGYPIVENYKYLGIYIDDRMNMQKQMDHIKTKLQKSIKLVKILKWKNASIWK